MADKGPQLPPQQLKVMPPTQPDNTGPIVLPPGHVVVHQYLLTKL